MLIRATHDLDKRSSQKKIYLLSLPAARVEPFVANVSAILVPFCRHLRRQHSQKLSPQLRDAIDTTSPESRMLARISREKNKALPSELHNEQAIYPPTCHPSNVRQDCHSSLRMPQSAAGDELSARNAPHKLDIELRRP